MGNIDRFAQTSYFLSMAVAKFKKREPKESHNVILGFYPPKRPVTLKDYIRVYGLRINEVKKIAKEIGIEPCLNGH